MHRSAMKAVILMLCLPLTGCATIGQGTSEETAANGCEWTAYILVSKQDELTEGTARQILAHNQIRQTVCE